MSACLICLYGASCRSKIKKRAKHEWRETKSPYQSRAQV